MYNQGCSSYIHMDDGNSPDYTFTPGSGTLEECAAAVQQLDGTNGCMGDYFFYESAGYCNCPTDDCSLPSENNNAGGTGQLYKFTGNDDDGSVDDDDGSASGCTTTAYYWDGSSDVSSHDSSKCNEYSCDTLDGDCCGFDYETFCADGYTLVRGNQPGSYRAETKNASEKRSAKQYFLMKEHTLVRECFSIVPFILLFVLALRYCWPGSKGYKCLPPSTSTSADPTPAPSYDPTNNPADDDDGSGDDDDDDVSQGLAMEIHGSSNTAVYDWSGWTDGQTYDYPNDVKKTSAFFSQTDHVKLEVTRADGTVESVDINLGQQMSLHDLFTGGYTATSVAPSDWHLLMDANTGYQDNCNEQGFNVQTSQCYLSGYSGVCQFRLGLIMNENYNCNDPDTALGIGFKTWSAGASCNCCNSGGTCTNYYNVVARLYITSGGHTQHSSRQHNYPSPQP